MGGGKLSGESNSRVEEVWKTLAKVVGIVTLLFSIASVSNLVVKAFLIEQSDLFVTLSGYYKSLAYPIFDGTIGLIFQALQIDIDETIKDISVIYVILASSFFWMFHKNETSIKGDVGIGKIVESMLWGLVWPLAYCVIIILHLSGEVSFKEIYPLLITRLLYILGGVAIVMLVNAAMQ
ncbi:MAG: hypothetical protein QNJ15_00615 [Erythrobacter sp.]|nr:hypothetical protein [Erythrobacter sp.]